MVLACGIVSPAVSTASADRIQLPPPEAAPMPRPPVGMAGQPQPQTPAGPGRPGLPTRDARQPSGEAVKGTAAIRGRVVALDGGQPLRRVQMRIFGGSVRSPRGRMTMTDADGRYEFRDLPAGTLTVSARKSGFAPLSYGQRASRDAAKPIQIAEGQAVSGIDFALPRGSVITGRVVDEFGEPVEQAGVTVMQYRVVSGRRRLDTRQTATANDLGQYRLFGLTPGEYYVAATPSGGMFSEEEHDEPTGYAPTFFPGTLVAAEAQRITLGVGEEFAADLQLVPARIVRLSGVVVDSAGQPLRNAFVSARPMGLSVGPMGMRGGPIGADGRFAISNVTPGSYMLVSQGSAVGDDDGGGREREMAMQPITVGGADVTGLRLVTSRGATLRGRVMFEGSLASRAPRVGVTCQPAEPDFNGMGGGRPAQMRENQTFEIAGIFNPCVLRVSAGGDLTLKAVLIAGTDVTDQPIDLGRDRLVGDVTVVMTTQLTTLTGNVQGEGGKPETDYTVVAFSSDKAHWDGFSRRIRRVRADQNGAFSLKGLPAGEYLVVALKELESGAEQDPELLAQLAGFATPARLSEGGMQNVSLKLSELR